MIRRTYLPALFMLLLFASGLVLSQQGGETNPEATAEATPEIAFMIEGEIGRALPRKMVYDPVHERMAVVDAYNRLLLVDALNYATLAVLHERGEYGDLAFSHDGRWLAVGYNLSMELWNTESRTLAASLPNTTLGNVRQLVAPMAFSSRDEILIFYGVYPAPRALRLSENDTIVYPWVWHLPAARGEGASTLPDGIEALQMRDYPNGFVLSPDDRIVAALPARLSILDALTLQPLYDIPTDRYEQDPLRVWNSLRDNTVYVRPVTSDTLLQVDTAEGVLVEIPLNTDLTLDDLQLIGGLELGSTAQVIGGTASRDLNPLLQVFLGYYYRDETAYANRPLTVTLIDLVIPPAAAEDNVLALLFVYDEERRIGHFRFSVSGGANQMTLSPDGERILVRRYDGDEFVITYDLSSGQELNRFLPALRAIGGYRWTQRNRILAYDSSGEVIISDFQRIKADTNEVLAEDLRYSRSFDRFFWSNDSQKIITLAGTEWREWDIKTGEVLRRGTIYLNGEIIATSPDGYRYLTQYYNEDGSGGAEVIDMDTGEVYSVYFEDIPGSYIETIYANPLWTRFLVVYSQNEYGPYYPGNQVAMYDVEDGFKWLIAGDDLPPIDSRQYGWVDGDTAYVYGQGTLGGQPERIYGVEYAENGLPACLVEAFPDQTENFLRLWERMLWRLEPDALNEWTQIICADVPDTAAEVEQLLQPTPTLPFVTPTGVPIGEVPQCLTARYAGEAEEYAAVWETMTANVSPEEALRLAELLCEGIGESYSGEFDPSLGLMMFLDAETGERASGDYQEPVVERKPMQPIYELFEKTEKRSLGTALLSPNEELVAASSLPGELIIYRMVVTYQTLMAQQTATVAVQITQANLIVAQPSPSPTYDPIGTARPTLTPTPKQTLYPRPQDLVLDGDIFVEQYCPSETLYTLDNLPDSYQPSGRIYAPVQGETLWIIEPENGARRESTADEIPQCGYGINCQFSPSKSWILAESYDAIYVIRPDSSDPRVLWDLRTPNPPTPVPYEIYWSGDRALEWQAPIPVTVESGETIYRDAYIRDVQNVFPDPKPWIPDIEINEIPAQFVSRQPGGPWAVAYTTYNTGTGLGYKYYLYHTETGIYQQFAQSEHIQLAYVYWDPFGSRLFYQFGDEYDLNEPAYQVTFPEVRNQELGYNTGGVWSNEGRYRVFSTDSRAQPIAVWDTWDGIVRTYCLPENGARLYEGNFLWSPDSRYVALQTTLPKDEALGQHTVILNVETGEVVDLTIGVGGFILWAQEPGTYGSGEVVTPTPTVTMTPTADS